MEKLKAYFAPHGRKAEPKRQFAAAVGVHYATVMCWLSGKQRPDFDQMQAIARETDGQIMPNDWMEESQ